MKIVRKAFRVVDDMSLVRLLTSFIIIVVVFGLLYWCLSGFGQGVGQNNKPMTDVSILTGIYFSIVTVSSLGYGDFHPVGFSKILVSVEVLFGLVFIGMMIAKITSRSLSNLVSRLFISETRKQLDEFIRMFNQIEANFREMLIEISSVYHPVPILPSGPIENQIQSREKILTTDISSNFKESVYELRKSCAKLRDYFRREINEGIYFELAPTESIMELTVSVCETFFHVSQCIMSLPSKSDPTIFDDILNRYNRTLISEAVEYQKEICSISLEYSKDDRIRKAFEKIQEECARTTSSYYQTPDDKPDQVVSESSEPQRT